MSKPCGILFLCKNCKCYKISKLSIANWFLENIIND